MSQISAADISKLRKLTGAGMMDCKNALVEGNGDVEKAIEIIRKRGQAIANKRADREAGEGAVLSTVSDNNKVGVIMALNCETDFVAKNDNFVGLAKLILNAALDKKPSNLDELKNLQINGKPATDVILDNIAAIGEKVEISYYAKIEAEFVVPYIHTGNKLATLVGFNKSISDIQVGKDIAMQVAAMNPIAIDKGDVSKETIEKEIEIGKEQARREGKPEEMLERIAQGKLNKFYSESTLLNQDFVKDSKKTIRQYLSEVDKDLTVVAFKRCSLTI
ncbi:MAG: translation elongation factor Ts [Bacteroidetes bacterium GWA2_30_7]|nr:MAG: translation elongation factor Ts [Bacteroidetes bacterium GWA2_30_7]